MCPILPKVAGSNENVCTFHDFLTSNTIKNANIKVVQLSDCCSLSNESDFTSKNNGKSDQRSRIPQHERKFSHSASNLSFTPKDYIFINVNVS